MHISISNIAWDPDEDEAVAEVLRGRGVDRIDIAPGKYFADPAAVSDAAAATVRGAWADRGFAIVGMQSLLFGTQGLNLFGDDGTMLARLARVCDLAGKLGIAALTFGSPKNRDRGTLSNAAAQDQAVAFFRKLGDAAADAGVIVCLEPNPTMYGSNFMITTDETAAIVRATAHPAIALQLDVGAIAANGEAATATIEAHADIIGHVHASEPGLVAMGEGGSPHSEAGAALRRLRPDRTVTIEMVKTEGPQAARIDRSVALINQAYGDTA